MSILHPAIKEMENIYLDTFKLESFNTLKRGSIVLEVHTYFVMKTYMFTFGVIDEVQKTYNDLRLGRILSDESRDAANLTAPLFIMTMVSQKLYAYVDSLANEFLPHPLSILIQEAAELVTAHTNQGNDIADPTYQAGMSVERWVKVFEDNPWLLAGYVLSLTGFDLIDNMYSHMNQLQALLKEWGIE